MRLVKHEMVIDICMFLETWDTHMNFLIFVIYVYNILSQVCLYMYVVFLMIYYMHICDLWGCACLCMFLHFRLLQSLYMLYMLDLMFLASLCMYMCDIWYLDIFLIHTYSFSDISLWYRFWGLVMIYILRTMYQSIYARRV